jgi:Xaa-Pro aminopeptidase
MKYSSVPNHFFSENRRRILASLPTNSFAVLHSAEIPWKCADGSQHFIQNSDLYFLTGVDQEESMLVLCPAHSDPAQRELLFVRESSPLIEIWEGHKLTKEEASEVSGMITVKWNDQFEEHIRSLAQQHSQIFLNYNEHGRSCGPIGITPDDRYRHHIQTLYPNHRFARLAPLLHEVRQVKSEVEIARLSKACEITALGFQRILKMVTPGVMEYEVEAELAHEFLKHGSRGFAYEPIIASGVNACILHYTVNDQPCRDGDLLLLDVAAEYGNYNADLTRTIPVNGKFTDRQRAVYNAVLRVFRLCIDQLIVPGKNIRKEFAPQVARAMEEELIALGLLDREVVEKERAQGESLKEEKRAYRKYFMHGVSHSLGIDVHDVTPANPNFVEGMVVTVEPGIYLPEEGFGIRLENDIIVKQTGNIDLMKDIPIEADEIEAIMANRQRHTT